MIIDIEIGYQVRIAYPLFLCLHAFMVLVHYLASHSEAMESFQVSQDWCQMETTSRCLRENNEKSSMEIQLLPRDRKIQSMVLFNYECQPMSPTSFEMFWLVDVL
jgi:hypothetical protein